MDTTGPAVWSRMDYSVHVHGVGRVEDLEALATVTDQESVGAPVDRPFLPRYVVGSGLLRTPTVSSRAGDQLHAHRFARFHNAALLRCRPHRSVLAGSLRVVAFFRDLRPQLVDLPAESNQERIQRGHVPGPAHPAARKCCGPCRVEMAVLEYPSFGIKRILFKNKTRNHC